MLKQWWVNLLMPEQEPKNWHQAGLIVIVLVTFTCLQLKKKAYFI